MSTIREQIVAAAVAALGGAGKPAGVPSPVRTRVDSPETGQLPALTVYPAGEECKPMLREMPGRQRAMRGPIVNRSLILCVEALTKSGASATPDQTADPVLSWASEALALWAETVAFKALAISCDELGTKFSYEQHETSLCRATLSFAIEFQTKTTDPESVGK